MRGFIRNMKISKKLMLTPVLVTILLAIFGGISYFAFSIQKDDMGKVVNAFEDSQKLSSFLQNLMTIHINLFMALSVAPDSISTAKSTFDTQTDAIRKAQEDLKRMTNQGISKKEKELYKEAVVCFEEYRKIVEEIFNIIRNEDRAKLSDYTLKQKVDMYFVEVVNALKEILKIKESQCNEKYTLSKVMQEKIFRISLFLFIISIFLSIFLTIGITRLTLRPISQTVETIRAISGGNLTKKIELESRDEIGEMAQWVNDLVSRLKNIIVKLLEGSVRVTHFANLLDNVTENMARSIKDAASQLDSLAVASEEMAKTASEISKNCLNAAKSAETASLSAKTGAEVIKGTLVAMDKINEIVRTSSNLINNLGKRSTEIGEIVKLINDIADQTNLLALNAAIEAARAGEAGRGFAVVADEVRKLAERTTQATKEIGETIGKIQAETKQAVSSMESGVREVEKGVIEAKKSEDSLKEILEQIKIVTEKINQIAISSEEQTQVTDEITKNIQKISTHVQEISIKTGDNVETSQNLARISKDLQGLISYFKVEETENVSSALEDLKRKAKKIVDDAAQYLARNGKEKAFREFANPNGPFVDGDLYLFSNDLEGNMLFHAMDPTLVGKSHIDLKDVNGKFFVKEFVDVAKTKGAGWVEYFWPHPITKRIRKKIAYIKRVDDLFLGCGIFV